jgi:transposase
MSDFAAFIGIDWADQQHDICLVEAATNHKESRVLKHSPEVIEEWVRSLARRFPDQPLAVCLEQARGPLIFALLKYDFLTLYPINPSTLAHYREAFSPSRAKDDPQDADFLAELIQHHRDRLKPWFPDDPQTRTLQALVEARRHLVGDRTRISNRLTALLKGYFPQVLDWFPDPRTHLVCDFLSRWPTLQAAQRARAATLTTFFRSHHSARQDLLAARLQAIKQGLPLTTDPAVIQASVVKLRAFLAQMRTILAVLSDLETEITALCQAHPDYPIFASLPGSGSIYAARLLAALGTQRDRFASADELACFSGIAPVIERSGQSSWIRWRYFCPKFFRQSFHEYAGESVKHSAWAKAYYTAQRAKGKSHAAAVRALAFKWMRIIWKCWQTRRPYNEAAYLESLRRHNSPLLAALAGVSARAE